MVRIPGSPPIDITLRRSAASRRFSLRISRLDGRVTLSMPPRAREAEALRFATEQEGWIRRTLSGMELPLQVGPETVVPVEGRALTVTPYTGRGVRVEGDSLLVPAAGGQEAARVAAFLKVLARDRLVTASDRAARQLGVTYSKITLRDTRSRWGSCAHDGGLMFSWRLIMAPPAVLDYVAVHEVAHLEQMNHSPAFWALVERFCPDWKVHRNWLHQHGHALHRFRF